jgi:hypothetical protein
MSGSYCYISKCAMKAFQGAETEEVYPAGTSKLQWCRAHQPCQHSMSAHNHTCLSGLSSASSPGLRFAGSTCSRRPWKGVMSRALRKQKHQHPSSLHAHAPCMAILHYLRLDLSLAHYTCSRHTISHITGPSCSCSIMSNAPVHRNRQWLTRTGTQQQACPPVCLHTVLRQEVLDVCDALGMAGIPADVIIYLRGW